MDEHPPRTVTVNDPDVEPHVWTAVGLLPSSSVELQRHWKFENNESGVLRQITYREWYVLRQTGADIGGGTVAIYLNQPMVSAGSEIGGIH